MSLIISIGALHVTREGDGLRFTIPTAHSSTVLTREQGHELTTALVNLYRKKKAKDGE